MLSNWPKVAGFAIFMAHGCDEQPDSSEAKNSARNEEELVQNQEEPLPSTELEFGRAARVNPDAGVSADRLQDTKNNAQDRCDPD